MPDRIAEKEYTSGSTRDTERDLVTGHKLLITTKDWLEWQANHFASSLLVPRATIRHAVIGLQHDFGITRNLGTIVLDKPQYSIDEFRRVLGRLCIVYNVTNTVMENRLTDVGVLEDIRDKDVKHISELLREG